MDTRLDLVASVMDARALQLKELKDEYEAKVAALEELMAKRVQQILDGKFKK